MLANLSQDAIGKIDNMQKQLCESGKEIVLVAYEKSVK